MTNSTLPHYVPTNRAGECNRLRLRLEAHEQALAGLSAEESAATPSELDTLWHEQANAAHLPGWEEQQAASPDKRELVVLVMILAIILACLGALFFKYLGAVGL